MGHSGGNDRFCARLKTDISAFSSGLQGYLRSCLAILDSSRRPLSKNVRHDLVRPQRPELEAEMSVFNLAQKRSFPPLCGWIDCLNGADFACIFWENHYFFSDVVMRASTHFLCSCSIAATLQKSRMTTLMDTCFCS
jgi:hypothetical protein